MTDWRTRLLPSERQALSDPAVQALDDQAQRAYFATNRRLGFWVTLVPGGVFVTALVGSGAGALLLAYQRDDAVMELMGSPMLLFGLWALWRWVQRLVSLRPPL